MILRVLKILAYMLESMFGYVWNRLTRAMDPEVWLTRQFRRWTGYVLEVFDADVAMEGTEYLAQHPGRKIIIMSNHQSQLDIPCLAKAADRLIGFVAKRELSRVPLLNYWMRQIGCIFIDRTDKRGAHQALEKAANAMSDKPLVVFPEGTRSKDGSLLPFKLGGTRLALLAQAVIVPVRIEGSRDAVEKRKPGARRIPVRLKVFPPFDTQGLDGGKASQVRIKEYVERCWHGGNAPS
ncbi:MAG: 1-acyl-sn-glycerol-3-phosphate acyltransferase [Fibrobacteres bacterium]|jgi:DNA helicase-2/ATP-dependent DNA helicase PcrA|nr:1-acyl-sn-glycerol-3-phosphate acyltransferase [Fibrobacterota bacterium]